ncbi:hypothetical protein GQ607_008919 [Colletotrichum asianum]|uniref:Uncharacterized protein n=1 Tax=Colletotrichum asianum TaxID=702518 RepID=A0A8H3ZQI1_9PEZI|nr:hypothetical protein GQ607_008919 [Colletotrichum asianum]
MFCRSRGFLWRRWATYGYCARCLLMKAGWLGGWEGFWFSSLALSHLSPAGDCHLARCLLFLNGTGVGLHCVGVGSVHHPLHVRFPHPGRESLGVCRLYTSAAVPTTTFQGATDSSSRS